MKKCWICGRTSAEVKKDASLDAQIAIVKEKTHINIIEVDVCVICKSLMK